MNLLLILSGVNLNEELITETFNAHLGFIFYHKTIEMIRLFNRIITRYEIILILLTLDRILQELILLVTWKFVHLNFFDI